MSYLESCSAAQAGPWSRGAALYAAQEAVGDGHGEPVKCVLGYDDAIDVGEAL